MQQSDLYISNAGWKFSTVWGGFLTWGLTDWQHLFGVAGGFVGMLTAIASFIYTIMLIREVRRKTRSRELKEMAHQLAAEVSSEMDTLR